MRVFIDGENFRHRIVRVLMQEQLISDTEQPFEFDIRGLIEGALGEPCQEINYYTSRVKQPDFDIPEELRERIHTIQEDSRRWTDTLSSQGVQVVIGGNLKVHDSTRCVHCHKKTQILQEKGVDVRLATDIVLAATLEEMERIVVVSSDTDMLPALEVAKRADTNITYICFDEDLNRAIAQFADQTHTYTRQNIVECYQQNQSKGADRIEQ